MLCTRRHYKIIKLLFPKIIQLLYPKIIQLLFPNNHPISIPTQSMGKSLTFRGAVYEATLQNHKIIIPKNHSIIIPKKSYHYYSQKSSHYYSQKSSNYYSQKSSHYYSQKSSHYYSQKSSHYYSQKSSNYYPTQSMGKSLTFRGAVYEATDKLRRHRCRDPLCQTHILKVKYELDRARVKIRQLEKVLERHGVKPSKKFASRWDSWCSLSLSLSTI